MIIAIRLNAAKGGRGVENTYVYPTDPINDFDLDGNRWGSGWIKRNWKNVVKVGVVVGVGAGVAACVAATAGICAGVGAGAIVGGGATASRATIIAANAAKGARGEKIVARFLKITHPLHKVETARKATGINTKYGWRYSDIILTIRFTGTITRYEVKTGRAVRNASQKLKDSWIREVKGQKTKCVRLSWKFRC